MALISVLKGKLFAPRSFGRFAVVGAVNTAFALVLFPSLYLLLGDRVGYGELLAFTYVVCPLFSFLTHRFITFQSQASVLVEGAKFAAFNGVAFPINLWILGRIETWDRISFVVAQIGIGLVVIAINYVVMNRLVFLLSGTPARTGSGRA